jgi:hypothetical protein
MPKIMGTEDSYQIPFWLSPLFLSCQNVFSEKRGVPFDVQKTFINLIMMKAII